MSEENQKIELVLKGVEISKLALAPGDALAVTIKSDDLDAVILDSIKKQFKTMFPNNKVMLFGLNLSDAVNFAIISDNKENSPSNSQNYCVDCNCGKKQNEAS